MGGNFPLVPKQGERTCTAVLWGRQQPRTLLCLFPIARAAGARRAAGPGGLGEAEVQEPAGGSMAGTPPGPAHPVPPPRETRQLRSPCPLAFRLLPPESTLKVLRPSAPPRIKGFACASARRMEHPRPQFLIPAIEGVAAEPAGQQGRVKPGRAPPPRHPGRTKARRAPNPRPVLAPWHRSELSTRKESIER